MSEQAVASLPHDVRQLAEDLGFEVTRWGEVDGELRRVDDPQVGIVGTHAEVRLFLRAWSRSLAWYARELSRSFVDRAILPLSTGGMRVRPGTEAVIVARSRRFPFAGRRLAISDRVAYLFDVVDVQVGRRSILSSAGPIPGFAFAARISEDLISHPGRRLSELEVSRLGRVLPFGTLHVAGDLEIRVRARAGDSGVDDDGVPFDAVVVGQELR